MNDPYVYAGSNVLVNKFHTQNQEELDQLESTFFQLAFAKLISEGFIVKTACDVFELHKILFSEVYEWAGNARTINIFKEEIVLNGLSVSYTDKRKIKEDLKKCKNVLSLNKDESFINELAKLIAFIWKTHPFREGNTRTIVVFLYFLLKQYDLNLDVDLLEKYAKFFRNALVLSSIGEYSEYHHLENILKDAIFKESSKEDKKRRKTGKYEKIRELDLKKYKYNYHTKK